MKLGYFTALMLEHLLEEKVVINFWVLLPLRVRESCTITYLDCWPCSP